MAPAEPCAYDHFFVSKLVFAYPGSVWQLMRADIVIYMLLYAFLAMVYMAVMAVSPESRITFEAFAHWLQDVRSAVPLSFLLGFYVSTVISRWWSAIGSVPYVLTAACATLSMVAPKSPEGIELARRIRCSLVRYLNLGWIIAMCDISDAIRYRILRGFHISQDCQHLFLHDSVPWETVARGANNDAVVRETYGELVTEDDMQEAERLRLAHFPGESAKTYQAPYWFPRVRALQLLQQACDAGFVRGERAHMKLADAINNFFGGVGTMYLFAMYKIPLVYTQVVIIAVYTYVYVGIFATQILDPKVTGVRSADFLNRTVPILEHPRLLMHFLPLAGLLEFVFYIGWFKIGMVLLEPFGREVADIPLSDVLDYNLRSGQQIAGHATYDSADLLAELQRLPQDAAERQVRVQKLFARVPPVQAAMSASCSEAAMSASCSEAAAAASGGGDAVPLLPFGEA